MLLGVDYYPEHWPLKYLDEDIDRIKKLGANVVRIGEFAWHIIEKEEGNFDFSFFDMVIEKLKKNRIKVIFGTPTATPPAWLVKKHPEILSKDENLMARSFGGRRQYCFNSGIYYEYTRKIVEALAEHYKHEENIIAWQVDNEFGHEGSDICYCENCLRAFRKFLREKYKDIDILNKTYGTVFWSQTYNDFDEVPLPLKTITFHNPSLLLDYARFRSKSIVDYANFQVDILKRVLGDKKIITTNIAGGFFDKLFDHQELVKNMDIASYDNYPVWGGLREPIPPEEIAMNLDFIRGLKGKNFWILEELMGAQGHNIIGYLPRPNQAKMWAYQAVAHGAEAILFFRYRAATFGTEEFCYGIIDHDNREGRKFNEVKDFFNDVVKYEKILESPIKSDIALIYDYENIWSWRIHPQSTAFNFVKEALRLYRPFYKKNVNIDVISTREDFSKYKVLLLPVMMIQDENLRKKLEEFVEKGGILILSFRAGIKDRNNNLILGEVLPGIFRNLAGIEVLEVEALQEGQIVEIENSNGKRAKVKVWRDIIRPINAKSLYKYADKFYREFSCVTVNKYKNGKVYYIGGGVEDFIMDEIAIEVIKELSLEHYISEEGIEIYKREYDGEKYLFIINHTEEEKAFGEYTLSPFEVKIVGGI